MCVINETYKCKKCGEQAHFVSGMSFMGDRLEQHHCDSCHFTFITRNGKFFKEGILPEPYPRDYPDVREW